MLTAYDNYKSAHDRLFSARTHEDIHSASRETVENFLENRSIWKELNHYKKTGTLLGEHPIFDWMKRQALIRTLSMGELVEMKILKQNNIKKVQGKLRREPVHPETGNRLETIKIMAQELAEVNRQLGCK